MELITDSSTVKFNSTMNDGTVAALHCEMRAFIRPDSSLIWEGPDGQRITDGMEKYEITFSDGSPDSAANGSNLLVPSRISTLTIINPEPSDAGTYACTVINETTTVTIDLLVNGSNKTLMEITESSSSRAHQMTVIILCSTVAILILIGLLVIAGAEVYCHVHTRRRRKSNSRTRPHSVYYNIIALLGLKRGVHHLHNESTIITCQHNDYDLRVDVVNKDSVLDPIRDDLNTTETNGDYGVTILSNVNDLTIDGDNNIVADTNTQENEAYGAAIDGIVISAMERNVAYDAITFQGDLAEDPTVDCGMNRGMQRILLKGTRYSLVPRPIPRFSLLQRATLKTWEWSWGRS